MSLLSSTRTMAVGTVASRATGFLRTAVLAAVLGVKGVALAFNVANTAPNIVYELLLGGILTSVVVPLLVRAHKDGAGEAYVQRLLTLTLLVLGSASLLLVLLAPQIVDLYANSDVTPENRHLAVMFARFFLPQIVFYGLGAILGAYLNTQGSFGPPYLFGEKDGAGPAVISRIDDPDRHDHPTDSGHPRPRRDRGRRGMAERGVRRGKQHHRQDQEARALDRAGDCL